MDEYLILAFMLEHQGWTTFTEAWTHFANRGLGKEFFPAWERLILNRKIGWLEKHLLLQVHNGEPVYSVGRVQANGYRVNYAPTEAARRRASRFSR